MNSTEFLSLQFSAGNTEVVKICSYDHISQVLPEKLDLKERNRDREAGGGGEKKILSVKLIPMIIKNEKSRQRELKMRVHTQSLSKCLITCNKDVSSSLRQCLKVEDQCYNSKTVVQ